MTVRPAKRLLIAGHVNRVRANLLAEGHGDDNDPPLTAGISDEMVHTAIAIIGPYVKHATQPNSARTISGTSFDTISIINAGTGEPLAPILRPRSRTKAHRAHHNRD
jgi:hypothetical protein